MTDDMPPALAQRLGEIDRSIRLHREAIRSYEGEIRLWEAEQVGLLAAHAIHVAARVEMFSWLMAAADAVDAGSEAAEAPAAPRAARRDLRAMVEVWLRDHPEGGFPLVIKLDMPDVREAVIVGHLQALQAAGTAVGDGRVWRHVDHAPPKIDISDMAPLSEGDLADEVEAVLRGGPHMIDEAERAAE